MNPAQKLRVFPLGYPVDIVASSQPGIDAAERRWGAWPQLFDGAPVEIALDVHEGPRAAAPPACQLAVDEVRFFCDSLNRGSFSAPCRRGRLEVSSRTLDNRRWFEYHLFGPLVLSALDMVFFQPVHAACVIPRERGLLLCGGSGAGKTTLAYAAAKAHWTLVSEDGLHVAPDEAATVAGGNWVFRLREESRALFPELADSTAVETGNGKLAVEVDAARTTWAAPAGPSIFLARRPGRAELRPWDPDLAAAYYADVPPHARRAGIRERLCGLLSRGCYRLEYERLDEALAALEELA